MKKYIVLLLAVVVAGCSTAPLSEANPPTKMEQWLFKPVTNYVERVVTKTNEVVVTNIVARVVTETNVVGQVVVITNTVPQYVTNKVTEASLVKVPEITLTPGGASESIKATGGIIGGLFGAGGLVTTVLGGIFGIWMARRNAKSSATAEMSIQAIETLREVLKSTPQGQQLDAQVVKWLQEHQREYGVMDNVMKLLSDPDVVSNDAARGVAQKIRELIKQ